MDALIPPGSPNRAWQPPAPEDLAPELPAYEILGLLGRGGMGAVYHARQKSLNREVAIKVLPPMVEDDGEMHFADRFKAEAQSMARLNHPGIVAVHDAGETPGGLLYFVMEFVQGTDVAQMIAASGRVPPEHAYAIVAHVCDALAYAHGNGIIHRDIKPANVMVDMQGRVKVADFGLAKAVDAQTGFTQSNLTMGTQDFVAPEALIPGMLLDARADLYAVGVMLYQMLTGQIPRGAFKPASAIVPGIDERFDQIIYRAMQTDREERHRSALELRQHLDTLLMPAVPAPDLQRYSTAGMAKQDAVRASGTPSQNAAGAAARHHAAAATPLSRGQSPAKSKTPLFIGVAAAIAVGVFVMLRSGKREFSEGRPQASASTPGPKPGTLTSSATDSAGSVSMTPLPAPKPAMAAARSGKREFSDARRQASASASAPKPGTLTSVATDSAGSVSMTPPPVPKPAMAAARSGKREFSDARPQASASTPAPKPRTLTSSATDSAGSSPSLPVSSSPSLPPELAALDAQFTALQKERVTAPYETGLSKLNSGYLGGIDKAIVSEKAAGHLDAILALEAEKKLLADKQPVPDSDGEKTPDVLKKLRAIWRGEHAKLLSARAAALKALLEPLDKRLAAMESDLTKADRLADAKKVRGYREVLSSSGFQPESQVGVPPAEGPGGTPRTPTTATAVLRPAISLALKDGITNTLGMKFLPVQGTAVLFCIHETRRQDYAAYAKEVPGVDGSWKNQERNGIPCGDKDNHPVVGVSWEDAQKFCEWLSKKEGKTYRLPTDEEWSIAVGLGKKEEFGKDITPEMLNGKEETQFPWGNDFPPKTKEKTRNYADECWHEKFPDMPWIEKCRDGYVTTAPVMSFKANKTGLYDMGGNVWEWVGDWWNAAKVNRVQRGGSFYTGARVTLLSSHRYPRDPGYRNSSCGFRVVLVVSASAR